MEDRSAIIPASTGSPPSSPPSKRPLLIILCVLAVLTSGVLRLYSIDYRLSRCASMQGVNGLLWYLSGHFIEAARAYRVHYEAAGEPSDEPIPPDYAALISGDLQLAEKSATLALHDDPHATGPQLTLAELALRRGDAAQALIWCQQVLTKDTDQFDALLLASVAQAKLGQESEAIRSLNLALRHDRVETRVTSLLTALEAVGEFAKRPREKRPWCLLAQYYRYLRIMDPANGHRAIRCAQRALTHGDHPADAWLILGVVYDKQERRRKALDALQHAIEIDPTHAEALRWMSKLYGKYGDILRQYEMAKRAKDATPDDPFYVGDVSYLLTEKLGDYRQALELANETLLHDGPSAKAFWRVAWAYEVLGEAKRAVAFYQEAIRLDPEIPTPWLGLGYNLQSLGQPEQALVAYQTALSLRPRWFEPHRQLARLYHDLHRYPEAIDAYERAVSLGDEEIDDLASLCGLYHMVSRFERSAACFREVLRRDPSDLRAQRLLQESLSNLRSSKL